VNQKLGSLKKIYNFDELEKSILNGLSSQKLHHAIIVNAPESSGKFSFIKTFLTKYQQKNFASNLNIFSIDKGDKSYVAVEKVKKINEFLKLTAASDEQRFVIIDAADDLNQNASNALLKNLEEPPENVYFILISHNLENIIDTIKSRCRLFLVKNPDFNKFCQIFAENNFDLKQENIQVLFDLTDGSIGQALLYIKHDICLILEEIYNISNLRGISFDLVNKVSCEISWSIFQKIISSAVNKKINLFSQKDINIGVALVIKYKIFYIMENLDKSYLNKEHCIINILNLMIKFNSIAL
jgi:DNA polymerase-3 subunit delta'